MTNPNGQTPAQPTGKRQLSGASPVTSSSYGNKRSPAKADASAGETYGGGVTEFPGEVVSEMRKVIWPTGSQMLNSVLIVFAFLILFTLLMWSADLVASKLIEWVLIR